MSSDVQDNLDGPLLTPPHPMPETVLDRVPVSQAQADSGLSRSTFYGRLKAVGIVPVKAVTFREGVTPRLPLRRPRLMVAPGSVLSPLVAC
jgi:hypothetical protein